MRVITTSERLRSFLAAIEPTEKELSVAQRRVDRLTARLSTDFTVRRVLAVGSHWKGTAVRGISDVDLFVVFSRDEARKWSPKLMSSTLIGRVRRSVAATYPNTALRIDKQALTVGFEQGAHSIDVVPAIFDRFTQSPSVPVYLIPDGDGDWLATAPELHKRFVDNAHQRSGRKLKSLVRMLKWWAGSRGGTRALSSLYIEWFITTCSIPVDYTYQMAMAQVFADMAKRGLPPLDDPYGISDQPVRAARTRPQQVALKQTVLKSAQRALRALEAEDRGNHRLAIAIWRLIFNNVFPK